MECFNCRSHCTSFILMYTSGELILPSTGHRTFSPWLVGEGDSSCCAPVVGMEVAWLGWFTRPRPQPSARGAALRAWLPGGVHSVARRWRHPLPDVLDGVPLDVVVSSGAVINDLAVSHFQCGVAVAPAWGSGVRRGGDPDGGMGWWPEVRL